MEKQENLCKVFPHPLVIWFSILYNRVRGEQMKTNKERLNDILDRLGTISYIKLEKIPEIDLYMDQVTSFMEEHLRKAKRNPEDKALTKTMINNYAKNNLLPPPVKKKYSKEHLILSLIHI